LDSKKKKKKNFHSVVVEMMKSCSESEESDGGLDSTFQEEEGLNYRTGPSRINRLGLGEVVNDDVEVEVRERDVEGIGKGIVVDIGEEGEVGNRIGMNRDFESDVVVEEEEDGFDDEGSKVVVKNKVDNCLLNSRKDWEDRN